MKVKKLVLSGLFLALTMILPSLLGAISPEIGSMLSPIHVPVLLCGFFCGWKYGGIVGFLAPLVKFTIYGVPPLYPVGISMCVELATYGVVSGILYQILPKKTINIYVSLICAMIVGRVMYGISTCLLLMAKGGVYTFSMFITSTVIKATPAIIAHIMIIPTIVIIARKYNLLSEYSYEKQKQHIK